MGMWHVGAALPMLLWCVTPFGASSRFGASPRNYRQLNPEMPCDRYRSCGVALTSHQEDAMQREYVMRGKRVAIEEIDDVIGIKTEVQGEARSAALRTIGEQYAVPPSSKDRSEWQAFEQAGWSFVRP